MRRHEKKKKSKILPVLVILIILLGLVGIVIYKYYDQIFPVNSNNIEEAQFIEDSKPEPTLQIFKGNDRPIAVVLENSSKDDWPHLGLENAYLVYEIIVEGGLTKLMPIYKGVDVKEIGYIRSARPYFIDYALENDAVLVHYGHTIMTADDESKIKIDYIDGFKLSSMDTTFKTVKGYTTGNAKRIVASIESLKAKMEENKIRTTSTDTGLNYVVQDHDLIGNTANIANSIEIKYSNSHSVSYKYDEEVKLYKRFQRGSPHLATNDVQLTAKNIIVQFIANSNLGDTREVPDKGYQKLYNIGEGTGYLFINGKYINITWKKPSRSEKTRYFDSEGNEVKINDGITYIQIVPLNTGKVDIL